MADSFSIAAGNHQSYMRLALTLARQAPPKPTNFCVGAVLVDQHANRILSTGYTMELPGNTHAEQCCLAKHEEHTKSQDIEENQSAASQSLVLYTTMEPCNQRASGNVPCTETILDSKSISNAGIKTVYVGVREPEKFVGENTGRARLERAGVEYVHVSGLEDEILAIATAGHKND